MGVRVDEAGNAGEGPEVDDASARRHRRVSGADPRDTVAFDDHDGIPHDLGRRVHELPESNGDHFGRSRVGPERRGGQRDPPEKGIPMEVHGGKTLHLGLFVPHRCGRLSAR